MAIKVFYSWQMKTDLKYNFIFILNCLTAAVSQLRAERDDIDSDIRITRDTKGISGTPNIRFAIDERISESDIFIGDLTYVSYIDTEIPNGNRTFLDRVHNRNHWQQEGQPSQNVTTERGIALGQYELGYQRVISIMNIEYGDPSQLPFDLLQDRRPIQYQYGKNTPESKVGKIRKDLTTDLKKAIRDILNTEHERQKDHFAPFIVWKSWAQMVDIKLPLEITEYIKGFFRTLRELISEEKRIARICGLSGIGKTRLIYECFNTLPRPNGEIQGRILYVDENLADAKQILTSIRNLNLAKEKKILIVDNCSLEIHNKICPLLGNGDCRLSIITVSGDPDERINQYDSGIRTDQIILKNEEFKSLVLQLLQTTFPEFTDEDRQLLVDFSSGLPFIAKLMADNPDRGRYEPGTLTQEAVVRRLLGPLYTNDHSKAVMHVCSLFSQLGFKDELVDQLQVVAENDDLFVIDLRGENPADIPERRLRIFKDTCIQLSERQLLEIRGRTYAFRPSPLAVRLAEDWWQSCTPSKFARIIPVLHEAHLVEKFCEQFRYLRHVQNARDIVAHLCNDFFSSAEVLNTEVGSRLFRSFVYVNPTACTAALVKAFLSLSFGAIREFSVGRRNLVWSLEKLCFLKETFHDAISVLAAFSVGENENYANNATGQFRQLFHILLPGTRVDLTERWNVIVSLCENTDIEYQSLGITAMASALTADHFHRGGGAEDVGESSPEMDYKPSQGEVYDYWKSVLQKLYGHILANSPFKSRCVAIIKDSFYALCAFGGGPIVVPIMRELIIRRFIDPMEARKQIQFVINSQRIYDANVLSQLNEIYETLMPSSFTEKFKIYVSSPSTWEYRSDNSPEDRGSSLMHNIDLLSKDFLREKTDWDSLLPVLFTGSISEGFNFGKAIFRNADSQTLREFLDLAISYLSEIPPEARNIGIILGIFSEKDALSEAERIFEIVLESQNLKYLAFAIARSAELPYQLILLLLSAAEREEIPVQWFLEFNYGLGIRHLPVSKVKEFIQRLRNIGNPGKFLALYILSTWITGKEDELFAPFTDLYRVMLLEDSAAFFSQIRNSMDVHYYAAVLVNLLSHVDDECLAKAAIDLVIFESKEMEHYYTKEPEFYRILDLLQQKYFMVLWGALTKMYLNIGEYGLAPFHLKGLLGSHHDYQGQSDGLLFGGNPVKFDIIFDWCKNHIGEVLFWIAELLPVFGGPRSETSELHQYAKAFIDEFGDDKSVLGAIAAKMGTYGWQGSIVPKLKSDRAIFKQLIDHPRPQVREWAKIHLEDVNNRIQFEQNREAEGY